MISKVKEKLMLTFYFAVEKYTVELWRRRSIANVLRCLLWFGRV